ncbi:MAG: hypothetical protein HYV26_06855 [Candidatus Hydrogenedentes bacterium]|nr:hypothetical protein [Candidatus Hydrogenedentota bacterium]
MAPMKKFRVLHTCGHEATHGYSGREGELRQRQEWLARQPCQECWRKQQASLAQQQTEGWKLPPLEGGSDEVAWAEVIRAKAIAHNREFTERMVKLSQTDSGEDELCAVIAEASQSAMHELENITAASWWIENRFAALAYVHQATVTAAAPLLPPDPPLE